MSRSREPSPWNPVFTRQIERLGRLKRHTNDPGLIARMNELERAIIINDPSAENDDRIDEFEELVEKSKK